MTNKSPIKSFVIFFLSAIIIFSSLTTSSFAGINSVSANNLSISTNNTASFGNLNTPWDIATSPGSLTPSVQANDIVYYNLASREVAVGVVGNKHAEVFFDNNGNYVIPLEKDAFFPYEVQFKWNNTIMVKWFDTPDSAVQIGGHTFRVYSEQSDPKKMSQIGIWIGGNYVAARPQNKTFTNIPTITSFSILPLTEKTVYLNLAGYTPAELKMVKLSTILSGQNITADPLVVWMKKAYSGSKDTNYSIASYNDTIDLSIPGYTSGTEYLELIVGDSKQLSMSNTRYIVTVNSPSGFEWLDFELCTQNDENIRTEIEVYRSYYESYYEPPRFNVYVDSAALEYGTETYLSMKWGSAFAPYKSDTVVTVYSGIFATAEAASVSGQDITNQIWNQPMETLNAGLKDDYTNSQNRKQFTIVLKKDGAVVGIAQFEVILYRTNNGVSVTGLYNVEDGYTEWVDRSYSQSTQNNVRVYTYSIYKDYDVNKPYYLRMMYSYRGSSSTSNNVYVAKAVLGHYNSVEEINAQPNDIKASLFANSYSEGYLANYSGNGQNFTILDTFGAIYKITVKAVQDDSYKNTGNSNIPNPGSSDTYFRVNGASELTDVYVMPFEHDTYYTGGFQTVFTTNDVDLSLIRPSFSTHNNVNVYSGHYGSAGILQISDSSQQNFSNGPVQYSVAAENGINLKNYWVTFVKKHIGGSKLFVNGINGDDGAKREIFFDNVYGEFHDVFIANVGDEELTGLTATLDNAENVKLDDYWRIGGAGNDTLSAFDTTNKDYTKPNGELANVAKIRLLKDGEGDISGTLTISAAGQAPVVITLTGTAGNPKITTESIPEAVKFVPYAVMIRHNNKHDWNVVSMELLPDSKLPSGVILKPNGEIYGVPKETGSFPIRIRMNNSYSGFSNYTVSYTLVVKENTDINVDESTDEGYQVTTRIPAIVTTLQDYEFTTEGVLDEFIDFWLDGEKLVKNVDYLADKGSTKITVRAQTFQKRGEGSHTIAAEFRVDGDENKDLKRAAQNYKLELKSVPTPTPVSTPQPTAYPTPEPPAYPTPEPPAYPTQNIVPTPIPNPTVAPTARPAPTPEKPSEKVQVDINGRIIESEPREDNVLELTYTEDDIKMYYSDEDNLSIQIMDFDSIALSIPISALNGKDLIIKTRFGMVTVPNATLLTIQTMYGDILRLGVSDGSLKIVIYDENNKELPYNEPDYPFILSLPYKLDLGQKANMVVAVKENIDGDIVLPLATYKDDGMTFTINETGKYNLIYNPRTFIDTITHWAAEKISFVAARNLFSGTGSDEFSPDSPMTKAMFVSVLSRLDSADLSKYQTCRYDDVPADKWYTSPVEWAADIGIAGNTSDNRFDPDANITREQMAVILHEYITYKSLNLKLKVDRKTFNDEHLISPEAREAIEVMQMAGIIEGKANNLFDPLEATRAEVATIFMNLIEAINK